VVVICGWATQRDKGVFGDDTESFRPERRLDADEIGVCWRRETCRVNAHEDGGPEHARV
jgi:cytochrome P450